MAKAEKIDWSGKEIHDQDCYNLACLFAIGALPSLKQLSLASNEIGYAGMVAFADSVGKGALPALTELYLFGNRISDLGMVKFSEALGNGGLPSLKKIVVDTKHPALKAACEARGIFLRST